MQETFLRWQAADREQIEMPEALADEGAHQPVPQPAHLRAGPARDLRGPVAARAAARRRPDARPGRHRRAARVGLDAVLTLMERLPRTSGRSTCCARRSATPHAEIAEILDITEASQPADLPPRQAAPRRRPGPAPRSTRPPPGRSSRSSWRPRPAARTEPLVRLLTDDAMGAATAAARSPPAPDVIVGAQAVAQFLRGLFKPERGQAGLIGGSPRRLRLDRQRQPGRGGRGRRPGRRRHVAGGHAPTASPRSCSQVNPDKLERATAPVGRDRPRRAPVHRLVTHVTPPSAVRDRVAARFRRRPPTETGAERHEAPHRRPRSRIRRSHRRRPPRPAAAPRRRRDHPRQRRARLRRAGPHAPARDRPGPQATARSRDVSRAPASTLRVARVTAVDVDRKTVASRRRRRRLAYDTLVYALGSARDDHGVPGVAEHAHEVASRPGAAAAARAAARPRRRADAWSSSAAASPASRPPPRSPRPARTSTSPSPPAAASATGSRREGSAHLRGSFDRLGDHRPRAHRRRARRRRRRVTTADGTHDPGRGHRVDRRASPSTRSRPRRALEVTDTRADRRRRDHALGLPPRRVRRRRRRLRPQARAASRCGCPAPRASRWPGRPPTPIAARLTGGRLPHTPLRYFTSASASAARRRSSSS